MIKLADLQYLIFAASAHGGSWHIASLRGDAAIRSLPEQSGHSASRAYRTGFMSTRPSTTLAVLSGTGLNEAADAAVERSPEVDARAPSGAHGVAGVARCHPSVKQFQ